MCPSCHASTALTPVTESRKIGADVYRRRKCRACNTSFVSREYAEAGMKMPKHDRSPRPSRAKLHPSPRAIKTPEAFAAMPAKKVAAAKKAPNVTLSIARKLGPALLPGEPIITAATKITKAPPLPDPHRTGTHS